MTQKGNPKVILNFTSLNGTLIEKGIQISKIAEKVSEELGVVIGICPPLPYLVKYKEILDIPVISEGLDRVTMESSISEDSFNLLRSLGIDGVILNHPKRQMSLRDLERSIRNSRTNRLFTLVYSNNVAVSAAISKLDPNAIAFTLSGEFNEPQRISKIYPEMVENYVKRINLENPKVSSYCGEGIFDKSDADRAIELGVDGIILDNINYLIKNPYEFLSDITKALITTEFH